MTAADPAVLAINTTKSVMKKRQRNGISREQSAAHIPLVACEYLAGGVALASGAMQPQL